MSDGLLRLACQMGANIMQFRRASSVAKACVRDYKRRGKKSV